MKLLLLLILLSGCASDHRQEAPLTLHDSAIIRNVIIYGDSGQFEVSKGITIINAHVVYRWHDDTTVWRVRIDSVTLYPDIPRSTSDKHWRYKKDIGYRTPDSIPHRPRYNHWAKPYELSDTTKPK